MTDKSQQKIFQRKQITEWQHKKQAQNSLIQHMIDLHPDGGGGGDKKKGN